MSYRDDDQDLLNSDDKGVREARGVLTVLWRQLLVIRGIDGWQWDKLMRAYLSDPRNGIQNNSRDRSSARGNLNKELKRDDMTWRVFLKALNFLGPVRVIFSVRITWANGETDEVSARLKDRGSVMIRQDRPSDDDNETEIDPVDDVDDLTCSTHHPRDDRPNPRDGYTPKQMIDYINSRPR